VKKVDMSEKAILRRLKTVDQLQELCLLLMKAKKISDKKLKRINKRTQNPKLKNEQTNYDCFSSYA